MNFIPDSVEYIPQTNTLGGIFRMMEKAARICYKTENLITNYSAAKLINNTIIPSGHTSILEFGTVYLTFSIFNFKWIKYLFDRYSRLKFKYFKVYITTTYRTILQGNYKNPITAINNKFDKNWKKDLTHLTEPTYHYQRYCFKFVMDRVGSQSVERHRGIYGISYAQESTRYINYSLSKYNSSINISSNIPPTTPGYDLYKTSLLQAEKTYLNLIKLGWKPEDAREVLPLNIKTEFMMCAYKEDWDIFLYRRLDSHAHPHIQSIAKLINEKLNLICQ